MTPATRSWPAARRAPHVRLDGSAPTAVNVQLVADLIAQLLDAPAIEPSWRIIAKPAQSTMPGPVMSRSSPLLTVVTELCPGFVRTAPPWCTDTSQLVPGQVDGVPVIADQPVDPRPFWQDRARHEIAVYRALSRLDHLPCANTRARCG